MDQVRLPAGRFDDLRGGLRIERRIFNGSRLRAWCPVADAVEADEGLDPAGDGLFGANGVVTKAALLPHLIEQFHDRGSEQGLALG